MKFEQFIEKTVNALKNHYGNDYTIKMLKVKKNNGLVLYGISILPSDDSSHIAPTIYLEEYYDKYIKGETFSEVLQSIADTYEKYKIRSDISLDFFTDFEKVRSRVVYKLINYEMNEELLKEIPHIPFLDLAVVFYYYMENKTFGTASILINNVHMSKWGVGMEELMKEAGRNTPRLLKYRIINMEDMMRELLLKDVKEKYKHENRNQEDEVMVEEITDHLMECLVNDADCSPMYVLSNKQSQNGAACMLYPGVLEKIATELDSDLYILPSSIHEVIIIINQGIEDAGVLRNMVIDVNRTQLATEEILSNEVYYFSRNSKNITICKQKTDVK